MYSAHALGMYFSLLCEPTWLKYSQSGNDVSCILDQLIKVRHLPAFGKLISQVDLQVVQLIGDGHICRQGKGLLTTD